MIRRTSIKKKQGQCVDCQRDIYLTAGRCPSCYSKHRAKVCAERKKTRDFPTNINKTKMTKEKNKPTENKELSSFFQYAENVVARNPRCMECRAHISLYDYRSAVAHILPKSIFESVAANDNNFLVLGARCGCHEKTHTLSKFATMRVWPRAVANYLKFKDQITETHKLLHQFEELAQPVIEQMITKRA